DEQAGIDLAARQQVVRRILSRAIPRIAASQVYAKGKPGLPAEDRIGSCHVTIYTHPPGMKSRMGIQVPHQSQQGFDIGMTDAALRQSQAEEEHATLTALHSLRQVPQDGHRHASTSFVRKRHSLNEASQGPKHIKIAAGLDLEKQIGLLARRRRLDVDDY